MFFLVALQHNSGLGRLIYKISLVPRTNIQNLNDDQKCCAKMEILGIIWVAKCMVLQPQCAQCVVYLK